MDHRDDQQQDAAKGARPAGWPIDHVADLLSMRGAKPVVAVMSPGGDAGSTATVMLARAMSEHGRSVVLVDLTVSGAPSRLMTAQEGLAGIMDLLVGDAAFGETIHHDRLSNAHIVPQGVSIVHRAERVLDRLTMVIGALSGSYETVLLEFGAADAEAVCRFLNHVDADIVLSDVGGGDIALLDAISVFETHDRQDVIVMASAGSSRAG